MRRWGGLRSYATKRLFERLETRSRRDDLGLKDDRQAGVGRIFSFGKLPLADGVADAVGHTGQTAASVQPNREHATARRNLNHRLHPHLLPVGSARQSSVVATLESRLFGIDHA